MGFGHLGHTETPAQPVLNIKPGQQIINDDMGAYSFIHNQIRLEFDNIPFIKDLGLKAMWYLDTIFYKPEVSRQAINEDQTHNTLISTISEHTRISHGIGISYALSPIISIALYYNIGNLNAKKGDDPLTS